MKCFFVDAGEHLSVNLWPGAPSGTASGANPGWWDAANRYESLSGNEGNGALVNAHEFGHNIGLWDEYPGGSVIAPYYDVAGSIMHSGSKIMKQHWDTHPTAATSIHKWFLDAVGEKFNLLRRGS